MVKITIGKIIHLSTTMFLKAIANNINKLIIIKIILRNMNRDKSIMISINKCKEKVEI
jgi:hypothetical protein